MRIGTADGIILQPGLVQALEHFLREARRVIVERHAGIAAIAGDVNVFDLVMERQPIERHMRFQETAVLLRLDLER